jgi:hypothetical protein
MVIRILDHIATPSSYSDGETIYRLISTELKAGRSVQVSFSDIKSIPSAFVNAAFIRLLEEFSFDDIKARLEIVESTRQINRLIKDRFAFASSTERRLAAG